MRELLLGARLALSGGRTRVALTAVGVGLGVALLLVAASLPTMLSERRDRNAAREDAPLGRSEGPLEIADADTTFRDDDIRGRFVRIAGPGAPVPPGVARLPRRAQDGVNALAEAGRRKTPGSATRSQAGSMLLLSRKRLPGS